MSGRGLPGCGQPARKINLQCQLASAIQNLALQGVSSLSNGLKVSLYASASISPLHPKLVCHDKRIDLTLGPPISLVACRMVLAMVDRAKWNGKFVTHLEAQTSLLGIADVVGMCRSTAADETGLLCDMAQMYLRTKPLDFAKLELALINFSPWVRRFLIT